jgi:hypothetical protein
VEKIKYVILLTVLFLNACTKQNVKTADDKASEVVTEVSAPEKTQNTNQQKEPETSDTIVEKQLTAEKTQRIEKKVKQEKPISTAQKTQEQVDKTVDDSIVESQIKAESSNKVVKLKKEPEVVKRKKLRW